MSYNSVCYCQCFVNGCIYSDEWRCFIAFQTQLIMRLVTISDDTISDCNNPYRIMEYLVCINVLKIDDNRCKQTEIN